MKLITIVVLASFLFFPIDTSDNYNSLFRVVVKRCNIEWPDNWIFVPIPYSSNLDMISGNMIFKKDVGCVAWYLKDTACVSILTWDKKDTVNRLLWYIKTNASWRRIKK